MTRLGAKIPILNDLHCEKVSFLTFAGVLAVIYFAYLGYITNSFPTVDVFGQTVTYLFLSALILGGGYLGVIYYRLTNSKCIFCKETIFFWTAKA
jgi:hypothetical protein